MLQFLTFQPGRRARAQDNIPQVHYAVPHRDVAVPT
jgi:hypothetical protein